MSVNSPRQPVPAPALPGGIAFPEGIETASLSPRDASDETIAPLAGRASNAEAVSHLGATLGRYLIKKILGQGAFGTVYLAEDSVLDRLVAIKVPRVGRFHDESDLSRFLDEARTAAKLRHPGIVSVFDAGRTPEGLPFVALAYIEGTSLEEILRLPAMSIEQAARMMSRIAEAVAEAHRQGFVHRDLKPANILLDGQGNPYVADFGLAIHEDVQRSKAGEIAGTISYMSPEQIRGDVHRLDGRSDIWSLGVILYQLLAGRLPFTGATFAELSDEIEHRDPKPPRQWSPQLPKELERICLKAVSKSPTERFGTATDMADDLARYLNGSTSTNGNAQRTLATPRSWMIGGVVAAGVLLIAAIFGWRALFPWPEANGASESNSQFASPATEPLRVLSLDVHHLANQNDRSAIPRGVLGKESFCAQLRDHVTIEARLSRPAFAYLIAFRADGEMEVCFPEGEAEIPHLTDHPRYPSTSQAVEYGLNEGTGLWLFAVIASESPLPPFKEWRSRQQRVPWHHATAAKDVVFIDHGGWLETVTPEIHKGGTRGKGVAALEKKPVADVTEWLQHSMGNGVVRVVGFGVQGSD